MNEPEYSLIALAEMREALKEYNRTGQFKADKSSVTEAIVLIGMQIGDQMVIEGREVQ